MRKPETSDKRKQEISEEMKKLELKYQNDHLIY